MNSMKKYLAPRFLIWTALSMGLTGPLARADGNTPTPQDPPKPGQSTPATPTPVAHLMPLVPLAADPSPPADKHDNTRVEMTAGASTFLDAQDTNTHNLVDHAEHATVAIRGRTYQVGPHTVLQADGAAAIGMGELNGSPDLRLKLDANLMAGVKAGPAFVAVGARGKVDASANNKDAGYRERSLALPLHAGLTFSGEKSEGQKKSDIQVSVGPTVQYRVGESPFGEIRETSLGGRVLISNEKTKSFVQLDLLYGVAGHEYNGKGAAQYILRGQTPLYRAVYIGAEGAVVTMSDRKNKDGSLPDQPKDTEVVTFSGQVFVGIAGDFPKVGGGD